MSEKVKKCKCGKPAMHKYWTVNTGDKYMCCECHVKNGGAPSDWHLECMEIYNKIKNS